MSRVGWTRSGWAGVEAGGARHHLVAHPGRVGTAAAGIGRGLGRQLGFDIAAQRAELAALPMHARASVAGWQLALVHGDATSLAGWGFAQEHLRDAAHRATVSGWLQRAGVDAFACSHTCLPVFQRLPTAGGEGWVLNNGAAGMPNFTGDGAGLVSRIATRPFGGPERRFGAQAAGAGGVPVFAEALALAIDGPAWQRRFAALWPAGSDAHASYAQRVAQGPAYRLSEALRG